MTADLFSLPPEVEQGDMRDGAIFLHDIVEADRANRERGPAMERARQRVAETLARATDPNTSHAAARAAVRVQLSHQNVILGVLWRPMIPTEIGALTGLTIVQIDRRRKELLERGEIRLTGVERDGYQEWARAE